MRIAAAGLVATVVTLPIAAPAASAEAPRFVNETDRAGIEHVYDGPFEFFVGGGIAVLDCDADGRPDAFLAGGANSSALYRNVSGIGGALRFDRASSPAATLDRATGAYPIDIDGDGHIDLVVLRVGGNVILRGRGDCRFERANEAWGIDGGDDWTTAFSARWERPDAFPTLAFGNYIDQSLPGAPFGTCADNLLFRPTAEGSSYGAPIRLTPGWCTLSMLFTDWNRSGSPDLRVSNDRQYYRGGEEQLWRVAPGRAPRLYARHEGWQKTQIWGMGIASRDLDGDGYPEMFMTSMADNKLQTLAERGTADLAPTYRNVSLERGVTAQRPYAGGEVLPSTAWHAEFDDVNNDGLVDLFIAKGNVDAMTEAAARDPNNLLIGQPDGTFVERGEQAGVGSFARARGAALTDFNLDGRLDLIVINRRDNAELWRNQGPAGGRTGNWIAVRLEQNSANRFGLGSWIEVRLGDRVVHREVTIGGGHASGELGWIHLGLGEHDEASVRVRWPDGGLGGWLDVAANSFAVITRGATEARLWSPSADRAR